MVIESLLVQEPQLLADPAESQSEDERDEKDYPYWVTTSSTGFRRLHKCGGCNLSKLGIHRWTYSSVQELLVEPADKPCLLCWPELRTADDSATESSEESSSDESNIGVEEITSQSNNQQEDSEPIQVDED
jgi:hypothetical protein